LNAVRLMSMHKSKGLEFPIVYYPGLDKKFNFTDSKAFFNFDKRYGLLAKAWEKGFKNTILHAVVKYENYRDYVSERIRLFYVALTRAKEKIILLLNVTNEKEQFISYDEQGYVRASIRQDYRSYKDLLRSIPATIAWRRPAVEEVMPNPIKPLLTPLNLHPTLSYKTRHYPLSPQKESTFSKRSLVLRTQAEKAAMEAGNAIHRSLELIDYSHLNVALSNLPSTLQKAMSHLFADSRFARINEAVVHQEYEFYDETPFGTRHGIIDLMFEYSERIDILDYKLHSLEDPAYWQQLTGYRDFIQKTTHKIVNAYLFSLSEGTLIPLGGS
jgi:ATP-dependent helicase/nuclease subunit A